MALGSNKVEILITAKDKASKKLQGVEKSTGRLGSSMAGLGKLAGPVGILAGATAALGVVAVKSGAEFSRSFAQVATLLDNVTKTELSQMKDELFAISNEIGVSVQDAVGGLYAAISGGIPQGSWVEFMRTSMELAKAGAAELKPVVGVLAGIMKNYGLEVSETERVSNLLLKTVKLGVTTMDELGASLGDLLPTSKAAGLGLEETLGTLAALTQTSGSTNKSVTQLRTLIIELMRPTTKLAQAVESNLGGSFTDLVAAGRPLMGIMQDLRNALPEDEFKSVFGSAEGLNAALSGTGELYAGVTESMEKMATAAGTLSAALETVEGAPGQQLSDAAARLENAKIALGEALAEPAAEIVEGATRFAEWEVSYEDLGKSIGYGFLEIANTFTGDLFATEGYTEYQKYKGKGGVGMRKYWDQSGAERFGTGAIGDQYSIGAGIGQGVDIPGIVNAAMGTGGRAAAEALAGLSSGTAPMVESWKLGNIEKERQMFGWGAGWEKQQRGSGIDDLAVAVKAGIDAEQERITSARESMIPFKNDLADLAAASVIANQTFAMTAEKTAELGAIETEAAAALAELTAGLEAGTLSFEEVQNAWASQVRDAADAIENIRASEDNKAAEAIEEAQRQQAEEAARQLAVSKVQVSLMGKNLEEIAASGSLIGMTQSEINTLFRASQMNNADSGAGGRGIAGEGFFSDADYKLALPNMVKILGGNLGRGGAGVSGLLGSVARTGVHEVAPGIYYNVTVEGNVFAADDSGRAIVEAVNKYAAGQGKPPPIQV